MNNKYRKSLFNTCNYTEIPDVIFIISEYNSQKKKKYNLHWTIFKCFLIKHFYHNNFSFLLNGSVTTRFLGTFYRQLLIQLASGHVFVLISGEITRVRSWFHFMNVKTYIYLFNITSPNFPLPPFEYFCVRSDFKG